MEESKIAGFRDEELEESFTFSSLEFFDASTGLFPNEDEESYIEIALEPAEATIRNCSGSGGGEEEIEFRISFSSAASFPGFPSSSPASTLCSSTSGSSGHEYATGAAVSDRSPELEGGFRLPSMDGVSDGNKRKVQIPVLERLLNAFLPAWKRSPFEFRTENGRPDADADDQHLPGSLELARNRTRKPSKLNAAATNGGVMKFLIKFQSMSIRSMLSPFLNLHQLSNNYNRRNKQLGSCKLRLKSYHRLIRPFDRRPAARSRTLQKDPAAGFTFQSQTYSLGNGGRRSEVVAGRAKSCPSSIKSSPLHGGAAARMPPGENSVHAAIAHCKRSFGQPID
ncbi:uncharacterized protein LOC127787931 [Diospyros lotus]|uniref:uncharacterized protein LOC127787930 n=1 Tax=Diospyros lotus TaxID=55363 RepID=UPI0022509BEA|nr:uncharacterized protein LOC127787930 [Diospyros lotus]XP_052171969.1 uncharacterized protein LOC127787931 [Diospyros lotus]